MGKCCEFCGRGIEGFKRNTRKYCDDNCKQLAYYARQGMNWGKPELSGTSDASFNVKQNFTLNDKQDADSGKEVSIATKISAAQTEKQVVTEKSVGEQAKNGITAPQPYRRVESVLLNAIERHRERIGDIFSFPEHYWTRDAIAYVKWITIRVRCLLENILRLNNSGHIDRFAVHQLAAALRDLTESVYFGSLPTNYPFAEFIRDLHRKFQGLTQQVTARQISFSLSIERKAQLMAYRFVIAGFVPKCKFSELDFTDGIREHTRKEFNLDVEN